MSLSFARVLKQKRKMEPRRDRRGETEGERQTGRDRRVSPPSRCECEEVSGQTDLTNLSSLCFTLSQEQLCGYGRC